MSLEQKLLGLESRIAESESALVAFSGGVDSTLVLAVAKNVLGDRVLAVTAESDSVPERELQTAQHLTKTLRVKHRIIRTEEMSSPDYLKNPANRCYYCKSELYAKLSKVAEEHKLSHILNGINLDDLGDHRPGITAAKEAGVISPLAELGFNKQDVRDLARQMDLPNWEKPALACLSSRIPYGQPVTPEKLSMIEQAEEVLLAEGFRQVRVRHHGDMARIELPREDIPSLLKNGLSKKINRHLREIGFQYVTVDLEGYRSGSLNEALNMQTCNAENGEKVIR
ncbi:MAG TPA: ATP-dependent sacrificial sulfur transferase LarE [Nitrospinaceae bacterium]|nr:ATP-dependent sacrificial sulfur transferase LarE [Nitrospinaceae bacterium]